MVAFGFPLPGLLASEGNVSTGVLSATAGLQNDIRFVQISAPVQAGNSGSPLLDASGHVIGVVVAKLDALRIARLTVMCRKMLTSPSIGRQCEHSWMKRALTTDRRRL